MKKEDKYTIITVESYPYGWETKYYYLPAGSGLKIGDVLTSQDGRQYRIVDGRTPLSLDEIDLTKYQLLV